MQKFKLMQKYHAEYDMEGFMQPAKMQEKVNVCIQTAKRESSIVVQQQQEHCGRGNYPHHNNNHGARGIANNMQQHINMNKQQYHPRECSAIIPQQFRGPSSYGYCPPPHVNARYGMQPHYQQENNNSHEQFQQYYAQVMQDYCAHVAYAHAHAMYYNHGAEKRGHHQMMPTPPVPFYASNGLHGAERQKPLSQQGKCSSLTQHVYSNQNHRRKLPHHFSEKKRHQHEIGMEKERDQELDETNRTIYIRGWNPRTVKNTSIAAVVRYSSSFGTQNE